MIDARINEVYYALFRFEEGIAVMQHGPLACAPGAVEIAAELSLLQAVGSGCRFVDELPAPLRSRLSSTHPELLPAAQDLVPLALAAFARGEVQQPQQVQPLYVRDEISWKKLAEQGSAV
jgi:tRNA threonylcarbamoyladenosine biosynthesis protein TsaB